jgi:secondary thiamine-phosphate synthase enzyme
MITQKFIKLPSFNRGMHLITHIIESNLNDLPEIGMVNIFIKHTSASITINENADPSVRVDFNNFVNRLVPDNTNYFTHIDEGADDMPSHIKHSMFGSSITIPVSGYKLNLGIWQGIYLLEFRDYSKSRNLVVTIYS